MRHIAALLLATILIGACSAPPVSDVTASGTPAAQAIPAPSAAAETPPAPTPAPTSSASGEPAATPGATPVLPPAAAPPKPANITWTLIEQIPVKATGRTLERYRATWSSPDGVATQFVAYGVKTCLRDARQFDNKPCVVKGMRIPRDQLVKLGTVDGSARSMDISWELNEAGPGPYAAVLVRAVNARGNSIFAIAWSENVCWKCVY